MSVGSFSELEIKNQKKLTKLINSLVSNGNSWESLKNLTGYSENKDINSRFNFFLLKHNLMDIPGLSYNHWFSLVSEMEENSCPDNFIPVLSSDFIDVDSSQGFEPLFPSDGLTSWLAYAEHLKKDSHFSEDTINSIEASSEEIVKRLKNYKSPVKGIVIGNVQSGKTANMAAVMSKCADIDTNFFIILTGNVTNLRIQTQDRISNDLERPCDIEWINLVNELNKPCETKNLEQRLDFSECSNKRYYFCCLKNVVWLRELKRLINENLKQSKGKMKVLIIDDEADQASLNGKDIREEISPINSLIRDLVNDFGNKSNVEFGSISYIGYTATPYGNFLNENSMDSLYPRDFICLLPQSPFYIGPDQLFGNNQLDIFNDISNSDMTSIDQLIENNTENETRDIPESLKEALAWFCICLAIRRVKADKKPTSMLIHNSRLIDDHKKIADSIANWFESIKTEDFVQLCNKVFSEQTEKLTVSGFFNCIPMYGRYTLDKQKDVVIDDYPSFEEIKTTLKRIHETKISHIKQITEKINGEKKVFNTYGEYIHLCVDNSVSEPVVKSTHNNTNPFEKVDVNVRLVYPKNTEYCGISPGFIVIGGNTLSRGITVEGLVSSYFARDVKTGDTLMQMGRWFGYRVGYELLPRVWITESAKTRFEALAEADHNIREFLKLYKKELSPSIVAPLIQCPAIPDLRITSKNKSQTADYTRMIYMGLHHQAVTFSNNINILEQNISSAEAFVENLNAKYQKINKYKNRVIWKNVIQKDITQFLESYDAYFSGVGDKYKLLFLINNFPKEFSSWNVVLSGINQGEIWLENIHKVNRSKKIPSKSNLNDNTFSIGSLGDSKSWAFDFECEIDSDFNKKYYGRSSQKRHEMGVGSNPLMVLYCIDKNSEPEKSDEGRLPLNLKCDVLGVEILLAQKLNELIKNKEHDYLQMNME